MKVETDIMPRFGLGWCLTPLLTIFQLYLLILQPVQ